MGVETPKIGLSTWILSFNTQKWASTHSKNGSQNLHFFGRVLRPILRVLRPQIQVLTPIFEGVETHLGGVETHFLGVETHSLGVETRYGRSVETHFCGVLRPLKGCWDPLS